MKLLVAYATIVAFVGLLVAGMWVINPGHPLAPVVWGFGTTVLLFIVLGLLVWALDVIHHHWTS